MATILGGETDQDQSLSEVRSPVGIIGSVWITTLRSEIEESLALPVAETRDLEPPTLVHWLRSLFIYGCQAYLFLLRLDPVVRRKDLWKGPPDSQKEEEGAGGAKNIAREVSHYLRIAILTKNIENLRSFFFLFLSMKTAHPSKGRGSKNISSISISYLFRVLLSWDGFRFPSLPLTKERPKILR